MKRLKAIIPLAILIIALMTVLLLKAGATHATSAQSTCGTWNVVSSPNPGVNNVFDGISAISNKDIWAVGYSDNQTLTEHWNGTNWSVIPSANASAQDLLDAVTAISTNDVWAVGQIGNYPSSLVLTEHWNGTNWSVFPSPAPGVSSTFTGVSRIPGSKNVWAVGHYTDSGGIDSTLIELWNGVNWSIIPSPNNTGQGDDLLGVVALSTKDAWAVGTYLDNSGNQLTLTEHWNGTSWSIVPSPNVAGNGVLWAVARVPGSNHLWAVGTYQNSSGVSLTLTEYWNGKNWKVVLSPSVVGLNSTLFAVTVLSASNAWAVGDAYNNSGGNQALIEHWNGKNWKIVPSPNENGDSLLTGVTYTPDTDPVWAVGVTYSGGGSQTVTENYCQSK